MNKALPLRLTIAFAACLCCVVVFLIYPELDRWVSDRFYNQGFFLADNTFVRGMYLLFAKIHALYLLVFIGLITYFWRTKQHLKRRASVFLLCALLLGPGIMVNLVLKDNSVGRPRPVHSEPYGGKETFTPVFHYSGACEKNCSFVSGHAAIGFFTMALFWVTLRRRWLLAGLAMGALVGGGRILQGGHYFSDVIFAGWVVYFTCEGLSYFFKPAVKQSISAANLEMEPHE